MAVSLRPLSLGEILDRTAQLYRENFILFAGIASVYAGILLVLNLMQIGLTELLRQFHMARFQSFAILGYAILIFPVIVICSGAAMAANNRAVAWVNLGEPATIRGAYRSILPRLGRYLWIMAIAMFFAYLPFVIVYAAFFVLLFAVIGVNGAGAHHQGASPDPYAAILVGIGAIGILVLTLPAIVYAVWMAIRYSLAIPASVVENLKARVAIRRSIEMTRGARGRIFVLGLLIAVIQVGLLGITQFPFILMAFKDLKQHTLFPVWIQIVQQFVNFLTTSLIGPMWATGLTLFYYDQRIRKEGFDIEWMMQAAGLTVPAPATQPDRVVGQGFIPGANTPELTRASAPAGNHGLVSGHDFGLVPMSPQLTQGDKNPADRNVESLPEGAVENSPGQAERSPGTARQKPMSPVGAAEIPESVFDRAEAPSESTDAPQFAENHSPASGHDFSRAEDAPESTRALAPEEHPDPSAPLNPGEPK